MINNDLFLDREICPVCKSDKRIELFSCRYLDNPIKDYLIDFYSPQGGVELEYLDDASYILDECNSCGLVYQRYIPNDELMVKLYDKWIDPEKAFDNAASHNFEYYQELERNIEMAIRHFGKKQNNLSFLDFGMGWGEWCIMARAYGCSVFGMELSQARIKHASRLGIPIINWKDLTKCRFDFINADQVFEHIADPLEILQSLSKAIGENGVVKISVPNGWDIRRRLGKKDWSVPKGSKNSLNLVAPLEHINCFNEQSLFLMAKLAGLKPVNIRSNRLWDKNPLYISCRDLVESPYRLFMNFMHNGCTSCFFQRSY